MKTSEQPEKDVMPEEPYTPKLDKPVRPANLLFWSVLLIGMHSILIGSFIFLFTDIFYKLFFMAEIQNFFFVRQAGLFLFCLGLFNLSILRGIEQNIFLIKVTIVTKCLAFFFLVFQAHHSVRPAIIYLAAVGDGLMALVLIYLLSRLHKSGTHANSQNRTIKS